MLLDRRSARIALRLCRQIVHLVEHLLYFLVLERSRRHPWLKAQRHDVGAGGQWHLGHLRVDLMRLSNDHGQLGPRRLLVARVLRRATHSNESLTERVYG